VGSKFLGPAYLILYVDYCILSYCSLRYCCCHNNNCRCNEEQVCVDPPQITALVLVAARALVPAAIDQYLLPVPRLWQAADIDE